MAVGHQTGGVSATSDCKKEGHSAFDIQTETAQVLSLARSSRRWMSDHMKGADANHTAIPLRSGYRPQCPLWTASVLLSYPPQAELFQKDDAMITYDTHAQDKTQRLIVPSSINCGRSSVMKISRRECFRDEHVRPRAARFPGGPSPPVVRLSPPAST